MPSQTPPKSAAPPPSDSAAYEAWYDEQIRLGLEDIEAGRVISHEEFLKRTDAHLRRLEKKHVKAA